MFVGEGKRSLAELRQKFHGFVIKMAENTEKWGKLASDPRNLASFCSWSDEVANEPNNRAIGVLLSQLRLNILFNTDRRLPISESTSCLGSSVALIGQNFKLISSITREQAFDGGPERWKSFYR